MELPVDPGVPGPHARGPGLPD